MGGVRSPTPEALSATLLPSIAERLRSYGDSGVDETISPHDNMFQADRREHYFAVGRDAVAIIALAMVKAGMDTAANILDMPCGSGRVLRHLVRFLPEASIVAADIDPAHVQFCARQFGAVPLLSRTDLSQVRPDRPVDLLWCGSLLTHFPADRFGQAVRRMVGWLAPGGVAIFTMHGRWSVRRQAETPFKYVDDETFAPIAGGVAHDGFGYAAGTSVSLPHWVTRVVGAMDDVQMLDYTERGWDQHQDVLVLWKVPIAARPWIFEESRSPAADSTD